MTDQAQKFENAQPTPPPAKQRPNPIPALIGDLDTERITEIEEVVKTQGIGALRAHHIVAVRAALRPKDPKAAELLAISLRTLGASDMAAAYLERVEAASTFLADQKPNEKGDKGGQRTAESGTAAPPPPLPQPPTKVAQKIVPAEQPPLNPNDHKERPRPLIAWVSAIVGAVAFLWLLFAIFLSHPAATIAVAMVESIAGSLLIWVLFGALSLATGWLALGIWMNYSDTRRGPPDGYVVAFRGKRLVWSYHLRLFLAVGGGLAVIASFFVPHPGAAFGVGVGGAFLMIPFLVLFIPGVRPELILTLCPTEQRSNLLSLRRGVFPNQLNFRIMDIGRVNYHRSAIESLTASSRLVIELKGGKHMTLSSPAWPARTERLAYDITRAVMASQSVVAR